MLYLKSFIAVLLINLSIQQCPPVKTVGIILIKKILTLHHMFLIDGMFRCKLKSNTCPNHGITVDLQNIKLSKKNHSGVTISKVKNSIILNKSTQCGLREGWKNS